MHGVAGVLKGTVGNFGYYQALSAVYGPGMNVYYTCIPFTLNSSVIIIILPICPPGPRLLGIQM